MPLIKIHTHPPVPAEQQHAVMQDMAHAAAKVTGKPLDYMMVVLEDAVVHLGGGPKNSAYIDFRGIGGITPEVNNALTGKLSAVLSNHLNILPENIYITYTDVPATNWGWNNKLFG
jgi:phenylpyruvate tautomerase PptA (4-oxalocrotonate tautomerase family)